MSDLSALLGVNFSLLGTNLHAAYEKNGADGYAVLLIPSEQTADNSVNIGQVSNVFIPCGCGYDGAAL